MIEMNSINDGISGSIAIAKNALEYIREETRKIEVDDRSAFFLEISKRSDKICKKYWYMAGIYNQMRAVMKNARSLTRAEKDISVLKQIFDEQIVAEMNNADLRLEKAGKNAARMFLAETSIFVFSNSESILKALSIYKKQKDTGLIIHTVEGRPGSEGLKFAESCSQMGFNVYVYPDLNLSNAISNSDMVVIGADRLLCNEFFNKAGTGIVLDYADKYGKVSVIVADQSKILKLSDFLVGNIEMSSTPIYELNGQRISEISYYFERTTYNKVNRISTDLGNFEFKDFHIRYLE